MSCFIAVTLSRRYVDVESPAAYASPEASVLTRLFAKLLTDYLNELAYPADLAGTPAARLWRLSIVVVACLDSSCECETSSQRYACCY